MTQLPLDQNQDVTRQETHRLTTLFPCPDFVKSAAEHRTHANDSLPRHIYADPHNKLYPCHTAPATWLSALFFADKQANFTARQAENIKERIHSSAKYFGILGLVEELEVKVAAANNVSLDSLPDADFAIVWVGENGGKERHWPLRNATEVKYAANHFDKYRDEFVYDDRRKIAGKILEKAAAHGADIGEHAHMLSLTAGNGACAASVAADMLRERATLVQRKNAAAATEMQKLAQVLVDNPEQAREHSTRIKLASVVDEFDRANNLTYLYNDGGLPRAEEVLFAVTEKVARAFTTDNVETTTGNVYALADLEKLAVEQVREWLGDDFADAVSAGGVFLDREKLSAIVPTLDRGMAAMLDRLMQENKIAAVVQTKAAESLLPLEKLWELAAQNG
jgi:hypothetical protein